MGPRNKRDALVLVFFAVFFALLSVVVCVLPSSAFCVPCVQRDRERERDLCLSLSLVLTSCKNEKPEAAVARRRRRRPVPPSRSIARRTVASPSLSRLSLSTAAAQCTPRTRRYISNAATPLLRAWRARAPENCAAETLSRLLAPSSHRNRHTSGEIPSRHTSLSVLPHSHR